MCKVVLFDFNGTLLPDSPQNEEAWREFAKMKMDKVLTATEFQENVHGKNNRLVLEYLFDRSLTKEEALELGEQKEAIYRDMVCKTPATQQLMAGASALLDHLKKRGIPLNIATAAGLDNVRFYFDFFDLKRWFDFDTIIYDNGNMRSKPAPDYYLQAAAKMGMDPKEALVFEDSHSGLLAAKNAGVKKIIALETGDNRQELMSLGLSDSIVKDYWAKEVWDLF